VSGGAAHFTLMSGAAPDTEGSWSKIRYKPRRFTSGRFTVRFSLTARPKQAVWWGVALWDDGPAADGSQFDEINFGYTTDESFPNTQLRFESSRRGKGVSLKVDTGVDLYDGKLHTGELEYDATHVAFTFDGKLLQTITDTSVIPTDPMDFIIGPRLVTGSQPLPANFVEVADSAQITW
jgi:beta-glucanase (GH16 family)